MTDTTDSTTDTATGSTTTDDTTTTTDTGAATAAEVEKWKTQARKHEDRAKANANAAKELETLRQSSMNETEKAVAQARAEARTEALREVGGKLAEAAIRVAAAGRNVDVDALIEGVDASKFLDADGDPDTKAITAWVDRVAPAVDESDKPSVKRDLGLGARGGRTTAALNGGELEQALRNAVGAQR